MNLDNKLWEILRYYEKTDTHTVRLIKQAFADEGYTDSKTHVSKDGGKWSELMTGQEWFSLFMGEFGALKGDQEDIYYDDVVLAAKKAAGIE